MTIDLDKLKTDLIADEGLKQFPYIDTVGKTSIGIGRNLTDRGLSKDEVDYLYANDQNIVLSALDRNLPWWRNMTEPRQRVLANMCFEMGITKLLQFKNTLSAMQSGNYQAAHDGMLNSTWASQVPNRAKRLANMMVTG